MQLKTYQQNALDTLASFLDKSVIMNPADAFEKIIDKTKLGAYYSQYSTISGLENVPYCCIRIPTGGGKTILASHSIKVFKDNYLFDRNFPVVLWLVPSNIIKMQTVEALKNYRHPYRQAINDAFGDNVRVFDIGEMNNIRVSDLVDNVCVIVGTVQSLRVNDTEGRRVYDDNENYQDFFERLGVSYVNDKLEKTKDGDRYKYSFANMMAVCRPLMILDEAHNMVTDLSENMQNRVHGGLLFALAMGLGSL
jgi:type III restriction enzyme